MPSQYAGPDPDKVAEGRPWWKVCCVGCCLGFVVLFLAVPIAVRFLFQSGPTRVSALPESFPSQLLLFRPEDAKEILYYPVASKSKTLAFVRAPIAWISQWKTPESASSTASVAQVGNAIQHELKRAEGRNTVAVRWAELEASRDEVLTFYAGSLKQAGMPHQNVIKEDLGTGTIEINSQRGDMRFSLLMTDDRATPLIVESVSVVVEYLAE